MIQPPSDWSQGSGYVTKEMMTQHLPPAGEDTVTLLCGPTIMVRSCFATLTKQMSHNKERVLKF